MAVVKRIGWVLLGVLIGAFSTSALVATKQLPEVPTPRLAAFGRTSIGGSRTATLIRDTKSAGCWLLIAAPGADGGMVLAPAPESACSQQ